MKATMSNHRLAPTLHCCSTTMKETLHFANMVKESWSDFSILWLPVLSVERFERACAEAVRQLCIFGVGDGEEDVKEQFKRYTGTTRAGKWLLAVNNADDAHILFGSEKAKGIVDYLSQSEDGVVLFTTRTPEVADSLTHGHVVELGPMNRQDASDFLKKSLSRKGLLRNSASIETLLDRLTCLPLAIVQAAAYLEKICSTIAKHLHLLNNMKQNLIDLMNKKFCNNTRYKDSANAVSTT